MKLWGKILIDNRIEKDMVVSFNEVIEYQENLKTAIIEICDNFDIEKPYWLPNNIKEFNQRGKASFTKDNFIEVINFDKFVIEEIEE
ncbi:MAG: hypothetical protein H7Y18_09500 [Clostridiaceae bacterium]|nr:hypothetical protein [Clostridiaceae bacterium]